MRPSLPRRRRRTVRRPGSRDLPPRTALRTAPQARPGEHGKPAQLGQVSQSRSRAPAGRRRPDAQSRCERAGRRRAALEHHAARRTGRHRPARCAVGPCVTPRSTAVPLEAGESARSRRWGCAAVQMWARRAQHAPGAAREPGRAGAQAAPLQVGMAFGPRRAEANCSVTRRDILRFLHGLDVSDDDIRCAPRRARPASGAHPTQVAGHTACAAARAARCTGGDSQAPARRTQGGLPGGCRAAGCGRRSAAAARRRARLRGRRRTARLRGRLRPARGGPAAS